jgi:hypothetical protein
MQTRLVISASVLLLALLLAGSARPSSAAPKLVFAHYMVRRRVRSSLSFFTPPQ